MNTLRPVVVALPALLLAIAGAPAVAQPPAETAPEAAPAPAALDPELQALRDLLKGTYQDGARTIRFSEIAVDGAPGALFGEFVTAENPSQPEAHILAQFVKRRGQTYLRMFRLPGGGSIAPGLWAAPAAFPQIEGSRMDILTDLPVTIEGSPTSPTRIVAETPAPIPTLTNGAVEMLSKLVVDADGMTLTEQGFNAAGEQVWSFPAGQPAPYRRVPGDVIEARPSGLILVTIKEAPEGAREGRPGEQYTVHYTGWLTNGFLFDTSRQEGREPFTVTIPGQLIAAWNEGLIGMKVGEMRRIIAPPALGYGARGAGQVIPPDSWLVFDVELMDVKPAAVPAPEPEVIEPAKPKLP